MKLVIVSDTHGKHAELGTLRGDVLIHCGDFCIGGKGEVEALRDLDSWFARQEFKHIICTGGNHDFLVEELSRKNTPVFRNATYLLDEEITIDGIKFYGAPWIPELTNWAHYLADADLQSAWSRIPRDTNVLVTHTPPRGMLDKNSRGKECGCPHLQRVVIAVRPRVHCFGHIHSSAGQLEVGQTLYVNASVVNSRYEVVAQPVVVQLEPPAQA